MGAEKHEEDRRKSVSYCASHATAKRFWAVRRRKPGVVPLHRRKERMK
jgi:hypothetical protein